MKKAFFSLTVFLFVSTNYLFSQSDNDWLQNYYQESPNYDTIVANADTIFSDTTHQNGEFGYKDYSRWRGFWNGRVGLSDDEKNGVSPQKKLYSLCKKHVK